MQKTLKLSVLLTTAFILSGHALADTPQPAEITAEDQAGAIFDSPETKVTENENGTVMDITEPYGVDEFMYFLEGGVTLTSSDGTVTEIEAGEAVTIPKEWTGIWETEGYRKIWVIYSEDGSGL